MVSVEFTAPGGLGGTFTGGAGWIGPATLDAAPVGLRLVTTSHDGEVLAELPVMLTGGTAGPTGGSERPWSDAAGSLTGVMQLSPPPEPGAHGQLVLSFQVSDIVGRPVLEVLPTARFMSYLRPPNLLEIRPPYGNGVLAQVSIDNDVSLTNRSGLLHLEDLAVLQKYAKQAVAVPEEIDAPFANDLHEKVKMLSGEVITGTWDQVTMTIKPGLTRAEVTAFLGGDGPRLVAMDRESVIDFGGEGISLGLFTTSLHAATVAEDQPDDQSQLRLVPADDSTYTERAGGIRSRTDDGPASASSS